jgi:hypothetical protein
MCGVHTQVAWGAQGALHRVQKASGGPNKKLMEGQRALLSARRPQARDDGHKATNYRKFTEEEVTPLPPSVLEAAKAEGVRTAAEFARA